MNSVLLGEKWKTYLGSQPETGMGFQKVKISMNDGKIFNSTVLNGEHLMVESPFPVDDIKEIEVC